MMEAKVLIPVVVSVVALIVSGAALYYSQLQGAVVSIVVGEHVNIHHFEEGNSSVSLPISFGNNGATIATVHRVALLVRRPGSNEGYLLEPLNYQKMDENGDFQHDTQAMPIALPGRSATAKQVRFRSSLERPTEFQFIKPGTYDMTVLAWLENSVEPQRKSTFSLVISDEDATTLAERLKKKSPTTVRIGQSQWRKWSAHKLTEVEVAALGKG